MKTKTAIYPECAICFEALDSNLIAPIKCGHIFHEKCLETWKKSNQSICPLCRNDASGTVKLIYDIKFSLNNNKDNLLTMEQLIQDNQKLIRQNEIIKKQIQQINEIREKENNDINDLIEKYKLCVKNSNEYKNKLLNIKIQYENEIEKNKNNVLLIQDLENKIKELEMIKEKYDKRFELEEKFNKISNSNLENKQEQLNLIINNLLYEDDDGKSLNEYFYVLSNQIEKLKKENESLKKQKNEKNSLNQEIENKQNTIKIFSSSNRKRTFNEYLEERKKLNQTEEIIFDDKKQKDKDNKNFNTNENIIIKKSNSNNKNSSLHLFIDPIKRKFGPSFLKKNN